MTPVTRRRARFIGAAVALVVVGGILLLQVPDQNVTSKPRITRAVYMLRLTNAARFAAEVHRLQPCASANKLAKEHSRRMGNADQLFHSKNYKYRTWAENIGEGDTVYRLFKAFMHSHDHRVNMLSPRYSRLGVGFVKRSGSLWVTMVFFG
jgi:uncharacterized protein YkwD